MRKHIKFMREARRQQNKPPINTPLIVTTIYGKERRCLYTGSRFMLMAFPYYTFGPMEIWEWREA